MVAYKYVVHSDVDENNIYNEFDLAADAISYAEENADAKTYVDKVEVELNDFGEVVQEYGTERIWSADDAEEPEMPSEEEDEWLKHMEQQHEDEMYVDPFEADEFGDAYTNRRESLDADKMVEAIEENESEVECKNCFDLFPKEECIKTEHGYLCKECASKNESLEGTVELDLNDDRTPHPEVAVEMEEPFVANDMRKHEHAIKENYNDFAEFYLEDWDEAPVDDNNAEALINEFFKGLDDTEVSHDVADEEHAEEQQADEHAEELEEHINDRPAAIESDQVLQGADNAVVDCEVAKVIAHSEDEKPLDCKMEKPALEEPLAGEEVDIKINEDTDIKDLSSAQKNEVITDVAKSLADKDVNTVKAGLTREQGGVAYENEKVKDIKKAIFEEELTEELDKEIPWILQQGEDGEPEFIGWAKSEDDLISQMVANHTSDVIYENTYINELDKETYEYMKKDGDLSEDEIKELDEYFGITENLEEAKKDDDLPVDPEAAKLEVHTMLNDLVADEIEAINGYEEAKAEIMDTPIAHKDNILDTIDHVEDEEKEHVDELIDATTEIPFDKEEAPAVVEEPVKEEPVAEEPQPQLDMPLEEPAVEEQAVEEGFEDQRAKTKKFADEVNAKNSWKVSELKELAAKYTVPQVDYDYITLHYNGEIIDENLNEDPFGQDFPEADETSQADADVAKEAVDEFDESYPDIPFDSDVKEGDKIRIIHLAEEGNEYDGREGTVEHIDGIGQLHGTWGGLAVIPGVDEFEVITNESINEGVSLDDPLLKKGLAYLDRFPQKFAYVCSYLNGATHQHVMVGKGFDTDADLQAYVTNLFKDKDVKTVDVLRQGDQEKYRYAIKSDKEDKEKAKALNN